MDKGWPEGGLRIERRKIFGIVPKFPPPELLSFRLEDR